MLKEEIKELKGEVNYLKYRIERIEKKHRENNFIISGLDEKEEAKAIVPITEMAAGIFLEENLNRKKVEIKQSNDCDLKDSEKYDQFWWS